MKQRLQGIVIGILTMAMLFGSVAVFAAAPQTIEVVFGGVRTTLFGQEFVVRDEQGIVIEAITHNNRLYVPVDSILHAMGENVQWNPDTSILNFGETTQTPGEGQQPQTGFAGLLCDMQHANFATGGGRNLHLVRGGSFTSHLGQHDNGIILDTGTSTSFGWPGAMLNANAHIRYDLQGQYRTLTGTAIRPLGISVPGRHESNLRTGGSYTVYIRGDGRLLHRIPNVTAFIPMEFSADISGVDQLVISVIRHGGAGDLFALTDLRLYR